MNAIWNAATVVWLKALEIGSNDKQNMGLSLAI